MAIHQIDPKDSGKLTAVAMAKLNNSKKNKPVLRNRLIKNIADEDWDNFQAIVAGHNKQFPDNKISLRTFFKLMNTYSPLIQSLMCLDPNDSPIQQLGVSTALCHAKMWISNIGDNISRIKSEHDIRELKSQFIGKSALVVGAGSSLYNNASHTNHLEVIKEYADRFDGIIIVTGHMLKECLELGIGDYFTVVDGSEKIYSKFFDNQVIKNYNIDSGLSESREGYYRKINQDGTYTDIKKMSAILATCTNKKVVDAWKDKIYFYVASIPQEILPNATSLMCDLTNSSDINAGGNCGALGWNIAMWMGCKEVALVGMDYSIKIDSPLETDSNYEQFHTQFGDKARELCYKYGYNEFFKTPYLIDDIWQTFKDVAHIWFDAYDKHGQKTYNCSEGGALEGKGITQMYLRDFLESHIKKE